jgi:hypothetical protein
MWRVVSVYRIITLAYAAVLIIRDRHLYAHPGGGLAALAAMACWTVVTVLEVMITGCYPRVGASAIKP